MSDDIAIKVDHVSKDFVLPHEKVNSVKSLFTSAIKKRTKNTSETQHALKDISFEIKKGEFFGIVGRNGSGKSTLLKILAGIYQPTSGSTQTYGKLVPFIELGVGFNPELTGRENVYLNGALLGFTKAQINSMYDEIVEFAELENFMDQKLKNYSSGMQVRLAFSMATRSEADILLVDEVLAVGDADFQKKCFRYFRGLKEQKKTVVFVSHDMNAVQDYCDRAILIEAAELTIEGDPFDVASAYNFMFIDKKIKQDTEMKPDRWGDKSTSYEKVEVYPDTIGKNDKDVVLKTQTLIKKDIDNLILGFKIRSEGNVSILGSNTYLKHQKLYNLKKGQVVDLEWRFPNLFNTGLYYVDLAAQNKNYEVTYESWDAAISFKVDRKENNSYPILPSIELGIERFEK